MNQWLRASSAYVINIAVTATNPNSVNLSIFIFLRLYAPRAAATSLVPRSSLSISGDTRVEMNFPLIAFCLF